MYYYFKNILLFSIILFIYICMISIQSLFTEIVQPKCNLKRCDTYRNIFGNAIPRGSICTIPLFSFFFLTKISHFLLKLPKRVSKTN